MLSLGRLLSAAGQVNKYIVKHTVYIFRAVRANFRLIDKQKLHRWPNHHTHFKSQAREVQSVWWVNLSCNSWCWKWCKKGERVDLKPHIGYSFHTEHIKTINTGESKFIFEVSCTDYVVAIAQPNLRSVLLTHKPRWGVPSSHCLQHKPQSAGIRQGRLRKLSSARVTNTIP